MEKYPDDVRVIHNFLSKSKCHSLIKGSELKGYEEAGIDTGYGQEIHKEIRNNDRLFFDDIPLAMSIYEQMLPYLPEKIDGWEAYSLNERFRFYRYEKEQYFKWHKDGSYKRTYDEVSKLTLMIYLNDDYSGGETEFKEFTIQPRTGSALIFPHRLLHQGSTITSGTKYILRTDVMYEKSLF